MSLLEVLKDGVRRVAEDPKSGSWFAGAEGDAITLRFGGETTVTFTVRDGRLSLVEGEMPAAKGVAETTTADFVKFINGSMAFGGLFVHEMGEHFRPTKGEFYDFGGDFFLLNPVTERLAALYRESPDFRKAIDACH